MKRRLVFLLALTLVLLGTGVALAQGGYELSWWTAPGGGGLSAGTGYSLSGAIGQPAAGQLTGTGYQLSGGFWVGAGAAAPSPGQHKVFLPLMRR